MFETGYLTVLRWKGTPIRVHWTTPIGMLFFSGLRWAPGIWLGFLLIVGLHEMGHAFLSRRMGLRAISIDIHALGGQCRYGGTSISPWQRSVVAWGGVLAQAILLAIALPLSFLPMPPGAFVPELLSALVRTNLIIIALNLVPFPPFDGSEAWKLWPLWRQRRSRRAARGARDRIEVKMPRATHDALQLGDVDEAHVRETVRRALADARESSRGSRKNAS